MCSHRAHTRRQNNKALITGDQNIELLETECHGAPEETEREKGESESEKEGERAQS